MLNITNAILLMGVGYYICMCVLGIKQKAIAKS